MLFPLNSYKNLTFKINVTIAEMPYCRKNGDAGEERDR